MNRFRAPSAGPLSQRELEVLELVAAGAANREAAARLFISEATVKSHLMNIYAKLGVRLKHPIKTVLTTAARDTRAVTETRLAAVSAGGRAQTRR